MFTPKPRVTQKITEKHSLDNLHSLISIFHLVLQIITQIEGKKEKSESFPGLQKWLAFSNYFNLLIMWEVQKYLTIYVADSVGS